MHQSFYMIESNGDNLSWIRLKGISLFAGLSIIWPDKSFKENDIFPSEKIVCSASKLSTKNAFHSDIGQVLIKKHRLKTFCNSTYREKKD